METPFTHELAPAQPPPDAPNHPQIETELHRERNIRPSFSLGGGLWGGIAYSALDAYVLRGSAPWTFRHRCGLVFQLGVGGWVGGWLDAIAYCAARRRILGLPPLVWACGGRVGQGAGRRETAWAPARKASTG